MNQFNSFLQKKFSFNETETKTILEFFQKVTFEKGDHFLEEGQTCKKIAFVISGALVYYELKDGEEKICDFAFEENWITQYKSLLQGVPSEMNIKTLEKTILYQISIEKMDELFTAYSKFNVIRYTLAEEYFITSAQRATDLASLNAEERYKKIISEQPQLSNRVPQYYLASYLGIKPQSLSRIRAKK